jgi:hypothetical protein
LNITRARFIGVVLDQAGRAFLAEATAALISSSVESGRLAICSPVAGQHAANGVLDDVHDGFLTLIYGTYILFLPI